MPVTAPVTHTKVSGQPDDGDPSHVQGSDWNASHAVDPTAFLAVLGILTVSADPNGTTATVGTLAWDKTNAQMWINTTGSAIWTTFVRADGGTAHQPNAFAFLGDSNTNSQGVNTDNAVHWNGIVSGGAAVSNTNVVLNTVYSSTGSSEPIAIVDLGTTDLRAHNVSTVPGYGPELSFGPVMFDLLNGVGTPPTTANKPWVMVFGISGVELKQMLPASTYGTSSPVLGGLNAYTFWKQRTLAVLAASGRTLGGITITLGNNDGVNSTDANNVSANMVTLATQIRADFGQQVVIVWMKLNVLANVTFAATVRTQMVTGAGLIPNCRLIVIDNYALNSDLLHYAADPIWDIGLQAAEAMRLLRGITSRHVPRSTVVGYGTPSFNTATLSPRGYNLSQQGDVELLFIGAMKNSGTAVTIPTPSGWTSLGNTSQAIGGQTQELALFLRNLSQTDLDANNGMPPVVSVTTGNDENYSVRVTIRGAVSWPTVDGSVVPFAATSFTTGPVSAGGTTTSGTDKLVLTFVCGQGGSSSPTMNFTATNATTSPTLVIEAPLAQLSSNFGLVGLFVGFKGTAGATGTTSVSCNLNTNSSGFTVAI